MSSPHALYVQVRPLSPPRDGDGDGHGDAAAAVGRVPGGAGESGAAHTGRESGGGRRRWWW